MWRAIPVALSFVALAAVGCSGGGESADGSRLTTAELGWVRGYAEWSIAIYNEELGPSPGPRLVKVCADRYEELGPPPSDRLESVAELGPEVCPLLARRGAHRRALDRIDEMDELLLPLLRDEQPLALSAGVTKDSRADLELSAFATREVGWPVEVRCWDDEDWRRVVKEDSAWTDDSEDDDTLVGWADESSDRIHMTLEDCNLVSELIEFGATAESEAVLIDEANAFGTLAHEVEHFMSDDSEAEVECHTMRSLDFSAEELGLTADDAALLAKVYRTKVYPDEPAEYREGGCPP